MADQNQEQEKEQLEQQKMQQQGQQPVYNSGPLGAENQPTLSDEKLQPVQDGGIPQNAIGIADGQYDALDPVGNAEITFEQGNYKQIVGLPQLVTGKVAELVQTLVPLIEISLIELMGSTSMYKRAVGQCIPSFDQQGKISINFTFQYVVEKFIGQDIELEAIQHDANYILDRIKPCQAANITKCEINVSEGTVTIMGTI